MSVKEANLMQVAAIERYYRHVCRVRQAERNAVAMEWIKRFARMWREKYGKVGV